MMRTMHRGPVLRSSSRRARVDERGSRPRRAAPEAPSADVLARLSGDMTRLALASSSLAVGYGVAARHAIDQEVAAHCASLASVHRTRAADLASLVGLVAPAPRIAPTCRDRLRWEWLASSARLTGGAAEDRILAECARIQVDADRVVAALVASDIEVPTVVRRVLAVRARSS